MTRLISEVVAVLALSALAGLGLVGAGDTASAAEMVRTIPRIGQSIIER
jgi:hypothetical protein